MRCYEKYVQVCVCNAKLFDILSKGDRVWHVDVLEVSGRCEGEVGDNLLFHLTIVIVCHTILIFFKFIQILWCVTN